jgi:NADH-quinone oxidoreductase subunit M
MSWLSVMILIPVVGAVLAGLTRTENDKLPRQIGVVTSVVVAAIAIAMAVQFDTSTSGLKFVESYTWIPAFGVNFSLGVDGIALSLIVMAAILVPVVFVAAWKESEGHQGTVRQYVVFTLIAESMMIGVFAATDLFLFYVFFEAILIPMYFLIGRFGGQRAPYAATKFLIYSLVGGLFMLASLIGLWVQARAQFGEPTFDWVKLTELELSQSTQIWLFLGFFIAFAIKAPMVPLHTWLPDAASEAQPGSATLMVGVLDKIGTFGMLRYLLPIFPLASEFFTPMIIVLSLVGIFYGALLAIGQSDLKRLIAYTSISHFGFITLGIFAFTPQAQAGAALYMVSHGFSTAALFLTAGFLISRRGSRYIEDFGGVNKVAPVLAGTFFLAGLSGLALPGMSSFVAEFLVLTGTYVTNPVAAIIASVGIVFAALYILLMYQRSMTGEPTAEVIETMSSELSLRERIGIAPVILVIFLLGFFPQIALNIINPAIAGATPIVVAEIVEGAAE